jgi:hypothetical protein
MRLNEMSNRYTNMLPQPPAEDTREAVNAFREFAEALEQYAGQAMDVEVPVSVHPEDGPDNVAEVQLSVYVPKTDYVNIVLIARCEGNEGFPVSINPYFAGGSFPNGIPPCQDRPQLDDALRKIAQSSEIRGLLDYMKSHAQKKNS